MSKNEDIVSAVVEADCSRLRLAKLAVFARLKIFSKLTTGLYFGNSQA